MKTSMSRSTFKILFYVKKGSERANGYLPLMCRLTVDGEIKQFSCKLDVPPKLWDVKSGAYNVFYRAFKEKNGKELLEKHGNDADYIFNSLFYDIRENAAGIRFYFNRDLTDNVLLRGLPAKTKEIKNKLIAAADKKCKGYKKTKQNV